MSQKLGDKTLPPDEAHTMGEWCPVPRARARPCSYMYAIQ